MCAFAQIGRRLQVGGGLRKLRSIPSMRLCDEHLELMQKIHHSKNKSVRFELDKTGANSLIHGYVMRRDPG
jgi:hypothetical protein